jgi:hypothetical protein
VPAVSVEDSVRLNQLEVPAVEIEVYVEALVVLVVLTTEVCVEVLVVAVVVTTWPGSGGLQTWQGR